MRAAVEQLLFFGLLGVAGWLLLVRPQRRRAQALQEARDAVHVGSAVLTTAGLHATVAGVEDETLMLEIAPGVVARFAKQAVVRVLDPAPGDPETATASQGAPPAQ
jgi:preprotein translocase subunit YajC